MIETLLTYETALRLGGFAGIFAVMALWELLAPRRSQAFGRGRRWPSNIGVVAALGAPAVAVLIFEVVLNATSMFNHGNVRLEQWQRSYGPEPGQRPSAGWMP